jgi:hypothetical protein
MKAQQGSCCPYYGPGEQVLLVRRLGTPIGSPRPHGALLQFDLALRRALHSVSGRGHGRACGFGLLDNVTPHPVFCKAYLRGDRIRWAVWLGRHPDERISSGPNGVLIRVRTPEQSAKAKARLMSRQSTRRDKTKVGLSEPQCPS